MLCNNQNTVQNHSVETKIGKHSKLFDRAFACIARTTCSGCVARSVTISPPSQLRCSALQYVAQFSATCLTASEFQVFRLLIKLHALESAVHEFQSITHLDKICYETNDGSILSETRAA